LKEYQRNAGRNRTERTRKRVTEIKAIVLLLND
jgi:hypothetical protein